jgi:hypothetical protein
MKLSLTGVLRKLTGAVTASSVSDNEAYPQLCLRASRDDRAFASFRSNPIYNVILEHVTEEQGRRYLEIISADAELLGAIEQFRKNDEFGGSRTFAYPSVGEISPTTLRYVKVLHDLKMLFGSLDALDICEIGIGYGGQCRIINAWFNPTSYCLVDLAPALALARRYLGNYPLAAPLVYRTVNDLVPRD